ncbi:MAG: 50S ribosomal protein L29 [Chloroflexi bacterium]|nr:50S ribosomal protein L29 [Chloroflexota bacterium]MBL7061705.1 50S ribosomal protein L29 [Dehalococcoidia bacterium]
MKIDEIRSLGDAELVKRLGEARQELFNLRLRLVTRQLANHRELPRVKKRIARIETVIRQRELSIG